MITKFVDRFMARKDELKAKFAAEHPGNYQGIVKAVIELIANEDEYDKSPSPELITEIDHGDYQGTLLYIIAAYGYQPSNFWYVKVGYGSCSGCDTLQSIRDDAGDYGEPPNQQQIEDYTTLALHIVQGIGELGGESI